MSHGLRQLLTAALLLTSIMPAFAQQPAKKFRAGAFAQDITPAKFPISVNGGMSEQDRATSK